MPTLTREVRSGALFWAQARLGAGDILKRFPRACLTPSSARGTRPGRDRSGASDEKVGIGRRHRPRRSVPADLVR